MPPLHYAFHVMVHPRPAGASQAGRHRDRWGEWPILSIPGDARPGEFTVGFEDVLESLGRLPRMVVEPDGAVVWVGGRGGGSWQVDGTLFDRQGRLAACEFKGDCPAEAFDRLLTPVGWPRAELMFELVRAGIQLDESTFRRHALARGAAGDGQTLRPG